MTEITNFFTVLGNAIVIGWTLLTGALAIILVIWTGAKLLYNAFSDNPGTMAGIGKSWRNFLLGAVMPSLGLNVLRLLITTASGSGTGGGTGGGGTGGGGGSFLPGAYHVAEQIVPQAYHVAEHIIRWLS